MILFTEILNAPQSSYVLGDQVVFVMETVKHFGTLTVGKNGYVGAGVFSDGADRLTVFEVQVAGFVVGGDEQ